jgi:heterodisulfide reductase subunit B
MKSMTDISYFPGCSLATSARENNLSLIEVARHLGYNLVELEDWNCCGSSSTHSINEDLAFQLAYRNLSLCPSDRPLLVACPSCMLRLKAAQLHLKNDPDVQNQYQDTPARPVDPNLEIIHFFELLTRHFAAQPQTGAPNTLKGLKFVPYYGCMLNRPPDMRHEKNYYGLVEKILKYFGAEAETWPFSSRVLRDISIRGQTSCCHTDGQPDHAGCSGRQSGLYRYRLCDVPVKSGNPLHAPRSNPDVSFF